MTQLALGESKVCYTLRPVMGGISLSNDSSIAKTRLMVFK